VSYLLCDVGRLWIRVFIRAVVGCATGAERVYRIYSYIHIYVIYNDVAVVSDDDDDAIWRYGRRFHRTPPQPYDDIYTYYTYAIYGYATCTRALSPPRAVVHMPLLMFLFYAYDGTTTLDIMDVVAAALLRMLICHIVMLGIRLYIDG
jgi:hypothetical protein